MSDGKPDPWGRPKPVKELSTPENVVLIPVPEYSHTIIRVGNGFILRTVEEGRMIDEVFEEPEGPDENVARAEALANLLYAAFEGEFQRKRQPGIKMEIRPTGYEAEHDEECEGEDSNHPTS